ncbi:class I SAM-dependent methyltransferase [Opitutales bacterium]|nr:class I SAM-dependent methyltransferase [Opitutales bacterium]
MQESPALAKVRKKYVVEPIKADGRTNFDEDILLGKHLNTVRTKVIELGRADFTRASRGFTIEEKVLLYAYCNMPGHIKRGIEIFSKEHDKLESILESGLLIYDIGCGPLTTCLAFADSFENKTFDYIGVDNSQGMLNLGHKQWNGYTKFKSSRVKQCSPESFLNWNQINPSGKTKSRNTLINFSFFFASKQLDDEDIQSLVSFVKNVIESTPNETLLLHVNSKDKRANRKYQEFAEKLGFNSAPTILGDKSEYDFITLNKNVDKSETPAQSKNQKTMLELADERWEGMWSPRTFRSNLKENEPNCEIYGAGGKESLSKLDAILESQQILRDKVKIENAKKERERKAEEEPKLKAKKEWERKADEVLQQRAKEAEERKKERERKAEEGRKLKAKKERERKADEVQRDKEANEVLEEWANEAAERKEARERKIFVMSIICLIAAGILIKHVLEGPIEKKDESDNSNNQLLAPRLSNAEQQIEAVTSQDIKALPINPPMRVIEEEISLGGKVGYKIQEAIFSKDKKIEKKQISIDRIPLGLKIDREKLILHGIPLYSGKTVCLLQIKSDSITRRIRLIIEIQGFEFRANVYGYVSNYSNLITFSVPDTNLVSGVHFAIWDLGKKKVLGYATVREVNKYGLDALIYEKKVNLELLRNSKVVLTSVRYNWTGQRK